MYILATLLVFIFTMFYFIVTTMGFNTYWVYEYVDPVFLILFVLMFITSVMATHTWKDLKNAVKFVAKKKFETMPTLNEIKSAQAAMGILNKFVTYECVFVAAFTGVDMLYHMDALNTIGPACALVFLNIVYGMVIKIMLSLIEFKLDKMVRNYISEDTGVSEGESD